MTITIGKSSENEVTITLGDTFDFNCVEEFRRVYESIEKGSKKIFVIDFSKTNYMDSSALGMLINMDRFWKGSVIRIVNSNPQLKKILIISRFDKKFIIE